MPIPDEWEGAVDEFSWPTFYQWWKWGPKESVAIVGAIGSGKSTLVVAILPKQPSIAFLATKPRDPLYTYLTEHGYRRLQAWPKSTPIDRFPNPGDRVIVWPQIKNLGEDVTRQRRVLQDAIERIFLTGAEDRGRRVVVIDEARYLTQTLGLGKVVVMLVLEGRALDIPTVVGAQRVSWVPREVWSEVHHIFIFGVRDRREILILRDLGGKIDPDLIAAAVMSLEEFECLYVNRISGRMAITTAPYVV